MRTLLLLSFFLVTFNAFADQVRCYSNGRKVYQHQVQDIRYVNPDLLAFQEADSQDVILTSMDCIVKISA
jgi:hypothetical protein